ncbi:MAG: hypothetical protein IPN74_20085 [Haliscomenobacter sp.]|nr:hypothetical protein [Haliscomenobacter sp.]
MPRISLRSWIKSSVVTERELFTSAAINLYGLFRGCTPRICLVISTRSKVDTPLSGFLSRCGVTE